MNSLLFIVILILIGYILARADAFSDGFFDSVPTLLTSVCYPAMILQSFGGMDFAGLIKEGSFYFFSSIGITLILFMLSLLLFRKMRDEERCIMQFQACIGNITFIAVPIISIFMDQVFVGHAVIFCTSQDLLIWTIFISLFTKSGPGKLKSLINPCIISLILGVLLAATGLRIPSILDTALSALSSLTAPLALIFLGVSIKRFGLIRCFRSRRAFIFSFTKTVGLSLLVFGVSQFFTDVQTAVLLALLVSAPTPLLTIIWAKKYGKNEQFATNCCVCSSVVYLVFACGSLFALTAAGVF